MVVDDSSFVYEDLKRILQDTEFAVAGYCVRGENVLKAYENLHPDVVTMDIVLPGMDGFEASEQLLEAHPDAKIVIVSSLAYDETEEKAKELGIQAFVFKPFQPSDIVRALRFATGVKMTDDGELAEPENGMVN